MEMFYRYLRELLSTFNVERLEIIKGQLEDDMTRLYDDERLKEKYNAVCKALEQLHEKKTA